MLPKPFETFPELLIMFAPLFSILNIPICNPGPIHPQTRLGLDFASDIPTLILLAVHPTHPHMGTLGNLPRRTRTCSRVSSVTGAGCCSSKGACGRGGAGGARGALSYLGWLCSANISIKVLISWYISPISVANCSILLSATDPPIDPAAGSNSSRTRF